MRISPLISSLIWRGVSVKPGVLDLRPRRDLGMMRAASAAVISGT